MMMAQVETVRSNTNPNSNPKVKNILVTINTLLLGGFFYASSLFASAPMEGFKQIQGKPLEIRLKNGHGVLGLGWKGEKLIRIDDGRKFFTLERKGWNKLPNQLLIIPHNQKLLPKIVEVKEEQSVLTIDSSWREIPSDTLIIWGQTPKSLCDLHTAVKGMAASLEVMIFPKVVNLKGSGFFSLIIKKQGAPLFLSLSNNHGIYEESYSRDWIQATVEQQKRCENYIGGKCEKVFQVPDNSFGRHQELHLPKLNKKSTPCPI